MKLILIDAFDMVRIRWNWCWIIDVCWRMIRMVYISWISGMICSWPGWTWWTLDECLGFPISRSILIFLRSVCMCFVVFVPCTNSSVPPHLMKRISLSERWISNCSPVRAWTRALLHIAFCIYFHCLHMFMSTPFMHFLIFFSIKKIITLKIIIQITWDFFHFVHHHV